MIELFDGYYITAEEYDYALCKGRKEITRKDGRTTIERKIIGYYGSVLKAVNAFKKELYHEYVKGGCRGLSEACEAFKEINTRVENLLEEIEA